MINHKKRHRIDYWVNIENTEGKNSGNHTQQVPAQAARCDRTLSDGTQIKPDKYWWVVGARRWLRSSTKIVYTCMTSLFIYEY
jgi:hypothetical protein